MGDDVSILTGEDMGRWGVIQNDPSRSLQRECVYACVCVVAHFCVYYFVLLRNDFCPFHSATMAGDHKCPVCQATFTRPQHVARHMRSRKLPSPLHLTPPPHPSLLQIPEIVLTNVSIVEISSLEGPFSSLF